MDRSWINTRLFGKAHLDGVSEFMDFVSERFDENAEILCPCRRCLNRFHLHKGQVEDHLYIHGMASTYTKWIYHGEPMEPRIIESAVDMDEQMGHNEDVTINVDIEDEPNDRLPDMVQELFNAEDEGPRKESMFAILLQEMKKELYPGAAYTRFSFVASFAMDTESKPVKYACADLLKCSQRQMRYRLKKAYFNGVPANQVRTTSPLKHMSDEQWLELVKEWSTPKHKDKCVKAKQNRGNVQLQQRTGSRCYIAHCHAVKHDKYKDAPPTAIDLFKECHCSSKTGFSEPVKNVIADMEAIISGPVNEGEAPKTPVEVISQVMPKTKFLQNVGIESTAPKSGGKAAVVARVEELEAELEAEKQCALDLTEKLDCQQDELASLKHKVDEYETERKNQLERIENLQKSSDETNALLRRLMGLNAPSFGQHQ